MQAATEPPAFPGTKSSAAVRTFTRTAIGMAQLPCAEESVTGSTKQCRPQSAVTGTSAFLVSRNSAAKGNE